MPHGAVRREAELHGREIKGAVMLVNLNRISPAQGDMGASEFPAP